MAMDPPPKPTTSSLFDVYLRLRPSFAPNAERFLDVEENDTNTRTHITIHPPQSEKSRKRAIEKFAFTRVFEEEDSQLELFHGTGLGSIVQGVLGQEGREGRDGLLATLGVTGSGKSHTILGSRSQRGLTQLSLDVLYQNLNDQLVQVSRDHNVLASIAAADVAESQLFAANAFLESIYGDGETRGQSRGTSRATTPLMVCQDHSKTSQHVSPGKRANNALYPKLYAATLTVPACTSPPTNHVPTSPLVGPPPASPVKSFFGYFSTAVKTRSHAEPLPPKDVSFMSAARPSTAQGSRRYLPRLSTLPQYPSVEDIELDVDQTAEFAIVISMYEVYNDRIFDLLACTATKNPNARRRPLLYKPTEGSPDRKVVAGLKKVVCGDLDEALLVLETGLTERRVAGTGSNATSSRSHGFFSVEVKKRHAGAVVGPWTSSALTVVDLAGSERARNAKTAGATLAEAGKINESLMYLGQCMQLQADSSQTVVPFRQCKLTELLFSNSYPSNAGSSHPNASRKAPQKAIMIVTADPLGDYNATSQILRYSALAREVTVPRIPSLTSTIPQARPGTAMSTSTSGRITPSGRATPSGRPTPNITVHMDQDLAQALTQIELLRSELELQQFKLQEEIQRRQLAEQSWTAAEARLETLETEIREEVWGEMEARLADEQRRWRAARESEREDGEAFVDRKLEILTRGMEEVDIYEDEDDEEPSMLEHAEDLEDENAALRERIRTLEQEREVASKGESRGKENGTGGGSPVKVKKLRVLKTRRWEGSQLGLDGSP